MRQKKITQVTKEKFQKLNTIIAFKERPSVDSPGSKPEKTDQINAADLFSFFTANIIKEQVLFTR